MIRSSLLFLSLFLVSGPPAPIVLNGTTQDCFEGAPDPVASVNVFVFQAHKVKRLVAQLKAMDQLTFGDGDTTSMSRFEPEYAELVKLVNRTHDAANGVTARDGSFSFTLPAADSLLIVGYEPVEDEAYYYTYTTIPGDANISIKLDMSRGRCSTD